MGDFMPTPYRGVPGVPHAPEELFQHVFIGAQMALGMLLLPGRVMGTEPRPRSFNSDYVIAVCDEAARTREGQKGKKPRTFVNAPRKGEEKNWQKKWWDHLHRRRWMQERMGGGTYKLA